MKLKIDLKALGKALWNAMTPMMLGIVGGSVVVAGMRVVPENPKYPGNPEYPRSGMEVAHYSHGVARITLMEVGITLTRVLGSLHGETGFAVRSVIAPYHVNR